MTSTISTAYGPAPMWLRLQQIAEFAPDAEIPTLVRNVVKRLNPVRKRTLRVAATDELQQLAGKRTSEPRKQARWMLTLREALEALDN